MFAIKRIKRLYFPWVIVGSTFIVFNNLFIKFNILTNDSRFLDAAEGNSYGLDKLYSFTDIMRKLEKVILFQSAPKISGAMWFLASLFFTEVIYVTINYIAIKVVKKYHFAVMDTVMLLIYAVSVYFTTHGMIDNSGYRLNIVFLSVFLFHIGQRIRNYETIWKDQNPVLIVFLALSVIFIFKTLNIGTVRYVRGDIGGGVQLFLWSMAGWFLVYGMSQMISEGDSFISMFLIYIGKHTLPIVLLHQISLKIVTYIQINIYNEPSYMLASFPVLYANHGWWIVYCIVGVCVPLILSELGKKIMLQIKGKVITSCKYRK